MIDKLIKEYLGQDHKSGPRVRLKPKHKHKSKFRPEIKFMHIL